MSVKYIFSHAGGSIPYVAARFAIIDEMAFIPGVEGRGTAASSERLGEGASGLPTAHKGA